MDQYWKIGQLAEMTGVTVRTLQYYDKLGLLKPARVTEAGHRLYNADSMTTLYRIVALKEFGFSLKEIADLDAGEDIDIVDLVDAHLARLEDEITHRQLLMTKLLKVKDVVRELGMATAADFQAILPYIPGDRPIRPEVEQLQKHYRNANPGTEFAAGWVEFITKLKRCHDEQLPNTHPDAIACVDYWRTFTEQAIGDDPHVHDAVFRFHSTRDRQRLHYGLTDELYEYLVQLMA